MKCKHIPDEDGMYIFELEDDTITLCSDCFFVLAAEINKQLVIEQMITKMEREKEKKNE